MPLKNLLALCVAGIFQVHSLNAAPGSEKTIAVPASVSVEEIPGLLRKVDDTLKAQESAFLGVVDSEAAAKRIPAAVGEHLRESFQAAILTSSDADSVLAYADIPKGNEKVAAAVDAFLEACDVAEVKRAEIADNAMAAIAHRTTDLTRNVTSIEELSACISIVQQLAYAMGVQTVHHKQGYSRGSDLSRCSSYLVLLKVLLWNTNQKSVVPGLRQIREASVVRDLGEAAYWGNAAREFVSSEDVRRRLVPFLAPFERQAREARERLEAALLEKQPVKVASEALKEFETLQRQYDQLSRPLFQGRDNGFGTISIPYQSFIEALRAFEANDTLQARLSAGKARREIWEWGTGDSAKMQELAVQWERDNPDVRETQIRDLRALLSAKLAQAKGAADLEGFASEVEAKAKATPGYRFSLFADPLQHTIEAAAKSLNEDGSGISLQTSAPREECSRFVSEWAEFQSRILREKLATKANSPELNQPPYSSQPVFESLENYCDTLAEHKDWRRLLGVFDGVRSFPIAAIGASRREETIDSLKSYLAARNFEAAELWTEAALAYKKVLKNSAPRTPIEDTALRLKALAKEHPEEVAAAKLQPSPESDRIK